MIEFEHSLFKLLLLVAVLSAKPPGRKWLLPIIAAGFLLAFLPPAIDAPMPWNLILGLTIPLLLWQNARRIIAAQWQGRWKDMIIWFISAGLFALVLWEFKDLKVFGATLFGLVAASMIWSATETERTPSIVSLIGPFTLIFLLAEVEPMLQSPDQYLGGIFSGLSFGAVIAMVAIYLTRKSPPKARSWITLGQIYLAYGFSYLAGVSAVAASLASVIVYVAIGLYMDFWPHTRVKPTPLNTWPGFVFVLVLFLLLGWEAHYPLSSRLLLEVAAGTVLSLVIAWTGQQLNLSAFPKDCPLWRIGLRVSLLLFPALLIWPRQTVQQPMLLAYAFGTTILLLVVVRLSLDFVFDNS
jgi:hypothetical protein